MRLENQLLEYVEKITGERPRLEELPEEQTARIPLFLKAEYTVVRMSLFQGALLLAVQRGASARTTPDGYAGHARQLGAALGQSVVLVLDRVASYARDRMVRRGIPFIVPGKQMFLPMMLIDLRERFPRPVRAAPEQFSAPAQAVLLFHLLGNETEGVPLGELARRVGYAPMTLSNVRHELEAGEICKVLTQGRSRHLAFPESRPALWQRVEGRLRSPVRNRHWVRWPSRSVNALKAGISALSHYSDLSEDEIPTFALRSVGLRHMLEDGEIHRTPDPEDADALVEAWTYDPRPLSRGDLVDRLSLYLSLRGSKDERVQGALEQILEEIQW